MALYVVEKYSMKNLSHDMSFLHEAKAVFTKDGVSSKHFRNKKEMF